MLRTIGMPMVLYIKAQKRFCLIFLMVALLSLMAVTIPLRSPLIRVISAASIATSVPVPMAKPTSAVTSAGASLIPSPTIPTIKPWNIEAVLEKLDILNASGIFAAAMDIDGAGLPFLKKMNPNAGSKSVRDLREIITYSKLPFIIKGVMTARGAEKAVEAGAAGIVVSNHGGRVLGQCAATAEVLPEIVRAVSGKTVIFVDGGIRTGMDVFKALALGADAAMIGRPFVIAGHGGGAEGIAAYAEHINKQLCNIMLLCGAADIRAISREMVRIES